MVLVGPVAELHALEQVVGDGGVAGGGEEGGEPVQAGQEAVLHRVRRDVAGPAQDARHAEAAFHDRAFALRERRRAAIGPGEDFGAVVGGEDDDGVVVLADVLELLQHEADVVIELGHAGFLHRPAILRVAHRFVLVGERCVTMCMRVGLSQQKNGLPSFLALSMNFKAKSRISSSTVSIRFGIERAGVLDLLLADLAPARHLGRVVRVGRPGVDHVARADLVQQILRIVGMRRVFHRVEVIEVAEELVEAVDGRQELVAVAEVVLAELAGGVALRFERGGDGAGFGRQAGLARPPGRPWSCRCGSAAGR